MILVNGKPFLEYLIDYFKKQGVKDFVFLTGYKSEVIEKYFKDGSSFGINIKYSKETKPLGTAGAIKNAEELLADEFIVVNGDTLVEIDLKSFIENHSIKKNPISITVIKQQGDRYGNIQINKEMVKGFSEKKESTGFINAGIYLLNKSILKSIDKHLNISIENDIFPKYLGQINAFLTNGYFIDIGTIETYEQFKKDIKKLVEKLL
jgi:NDP-sugar pyrophosphorylase family protein